MTSLPGAVRDAYELEDADVTPIEIGLINQTFDVVRLRSPRLVVQRLHAIFGGEVCLDLEAIATHVGAAGLATPRLVRTRAGDPFVRVDDGVWRAITYVPGRTLTSVDEPRVAFEAALLAARFHRAVSDLDHAFHFTRAGVHDTAAHLAKLERWLVEGRSHPEHAENARVAEAILAHARTLEPLPSSRSRIVHGDLKISNVRFDDTLEHAVALLDLDTLAHGTIAFELGDALRSWAQRGTESAADARADRDVVHAAMAGYAAGGFRLEPDERGSIVLGLETVSTELAARFAVDAWEDSYFAWDKTRYASRREHDRCRATSQLALATSVQRDRSELEAIVQTALTK